MKNNNLLALKILEIAPELKPIIKRNYNYKKSYRDWIIQNTNFYLIILVLFLSILSCALNFFRDNHIVYQILQGSFTFMVVFTLVSVISERKYGYWKLVNRECNYIRVI